MDARELIGRRVCLHLNLTTGRYTLADKPKGKKLADVTTAELTDVELRVYETQRRYCVDKGARFVHAYAIGVLEAIDGPVDKAGLLEVTYNPFRAPTFHVTGQERPVHHAARIRFADKHGYSSEDELR
jgi:hypothetical protein